jgi:hypothetical protein
MGSLSYGGLTHYLSDNPDSATSLEELVYVSYLCLFIHVKFQGWSKVDAK